MFLFSSERIREMIDKKFAKSVTVFKGLCFLKASVWRIIFFPDLSITPLLLSSLIFLLTVSFAILSSSDISIKLIFSISNFS